MITYEEAYAKARELKPNFDACDEYDNAYVFKAESERFNIGGEGACVILKTTGKAINTTEFFDNYSPVFIRNISV